MKEEIKSDLFGTHQFRKKQKNSEFLIKLSNLFYSDNPFLKANFMDEIDSYFKEGWERFISKYGFSFNKFNVLKTEYKVQLFFISAFSNEKLLMSFIKTYFIRNKQLFDWKVSSKDALANIYNFKVFRKDEFKLLWFKLVKLGFPDTLEELYEEDFSAIIYESTGKDYWKTNYRTDFLRDYPVEGKIQPYLMSSKNVDKHLSEFINYSKYKKNLLSSYSWSYWKSFDFVKTIADHDLDLLKLGPPSFHKNRSLIKQLLASHPSYYFKMKSRNLKKDKGITKAAITADPSLIDKIPRQYVENINPFILAQGGDIQTKKYTTALKGIVCITGKTISVDTKQEATYLLEDNGYVVSKTLTKECNYLLNETDGKTYKSNKIKKYPYLHITEIKKLSNLLEKN
jgi:hypothetical protein